MENEMHADFSRLDTLVSEYLASCGSRSLQDLDSSSCHPVFALATDLLGQYEGAYESPHSLGSFLIDHGYIRTLVFLAHAHFNTCAVALCSSAADLYSDAGAPLLPILNNLVNEDPAYASLAAKLCVHYSASIEESYLGTQAVSEIGRKSADCFRVEALQYDRFIADCHSIEAMVLPKQPKRQWLCNRLRASLFEYKIDNDHTYPDKEHITRLCDTSGASEQVFADSFAEVISKIVLIERDFANLPPEIVSFFLQSDPEFEIYRQSLVTKMKEPIGTDNACVLGLRIYAQILDYLTGFDQRLFAPSGYDTAYVASQVEDEVDYQTMLKIPNFDVSLIDKSKLKRNVLGHHFASEMGL